MNYTIGIDASRNRSGGAKTHIIGILKNFDVNKYNIDKVHVWAHLELINLLPDRDWLIKHSPRKNK